ncbi:MAG: MmgE/PrpD family protein, partial [Acetobacteraceae bacterium]|nr:MmgE/PrpD family protein [Acetobacteraceae bacterium]
PENVVDGQFSGPFVIASALVTGAMGWESYKLLHDARVRAFLPKISCVLDPEIQALFPAKMAGKVMLRARGQEFTKTVFVPKGEPENFLSEVELRAKFAGLTDAVLGQERAAQLANAVLGIDSAPDVASLMRYAAPLMEARLAGD